MYIYIIIYMCVLHASIWRNLMSFCIFNCICRRFAWRTRSRASGKWEAKPVDSKWQSGGCAYALTDWIARKSSRDLQTWLKNKKLEINRINPIFAIFLPQRLHQSLGAESRGGSCNFGSFPGRPMWAMGQVDRNNLVGSFANTWHGDLPLLPHLINEVSDKKFMLSCQKGWPSAALDKKRNKHIQRDVQRDIQTYILKLSQTIHAEHVHFIAVKSVPSVFCSPLDSAVINGTWKVCGVYIWKKILPIFPLRPARWCLHCCTRATRNSQSQVQATES